MAVQPHPGFGLFAKAHDEFFQANTPEGFVEMPGYSGAFGKVLSGCLDPERKAGCITRLIRWLPGTTVPRVLTHDWCEEVYLIEGDLWIGQPDATNAVCLEPGTYACRPAQAPHGPFFTKTGCLMLEFSYYPPLARSEEESPR